MLFKSATVCWVCQGVTIHSQTSINLSGQGLINCMPSDEHADNVHTKRFSHLQNYVDVNNQNTSK